MAQYEYTLQALSHDLHILRVILAEPKSLIFDDHFPIVLQKRRIIHGRTSRLFRSGTVFVG